MAWSEGLQTIQKNPWGKEKWNQLVTGIDDGDYLLVKGLDFGKGAKDFSIWASSHLYGGIIEIHIDSMDNAPIGTVKIGHTKDELREFTTPVKKTTGIHDLYFVFRGTKKQTGNLFNLDCWSFNPL